jgi:hypothetical protein
MPNMHTSREDTMSLRVPKAELPTQMSETMIQQFGAVAEPVEVLWHNPSVAQAGLEFGAKVAAIGAWTTPYLADAIAAHRAGGQDVPDKLLAHLSPIAWEPVNLLGQYTFDPGNARLVDDRRPLRSGVDDADEAA